MTDTLPFHVSFLRTIDNYERPPIDLTYVAPNPPPPAKSPEQIERAKNPFALTFKNHGFVQILDFFPTLASACIARLRQDEAPLIFAKTPVFYLHSGACAVSDATAAVLQRFNLGRSDLVWLEPPPDADQTIFRGAWTLWPVERYPTIYTPRRMYDAQPPLSTKVTAFTYEPGRIAVTGIAYGSPWHDRKTLTYLLPCRQPDTDVDLWVDPLWPQSLFLSNRLVEALDAEGLLMGSKDGWRTRPCRTPLPEEVAEDQVQPWIRTITDREWETMEEDTFRMMGRRAGSEANGRAAITSIQSPIPNQTTMRVANALISRYDERDMETVFTPNTLPSNLTLRKKSITRMESLSDELELHIINLAIPLNHPNIKDLTPSLDAASLPTHGAHIKVVWKTSNPTVYTDAILRELTQTLVDAATRGFDIVGVHWE